MQFQYNSTYPRNNTDPVNPLPFPDAQPTPCARITARIISEDQRTTQMVKNVLVKIVTTPQNDDDSSSSSSSSDDGSSDMQVDDDEAEPSYAYWLQRTIREAIYGRVLVARVLKRKTSNLWELTDEVIAVKEMSWQHIRRERHRLAEDPIQEVAALQYLKNQLLSSTATTTATMESVNVLLPKDILSDQQYLYSVMPYCNGGELFERLDMNERFSEPEARYWMDQLLNGIHHLESVGVCHRDISLENVLVHNDRISLIIDLGMCVRYPKNEHVLLTPQGTCGKWIYMSPEIYKNKAFHGPSIDLWAAGVILFLLLTGFPPWDRACDTDERYRYMSAGYLVQMLTEWQIPISADAMDLLQRMLFADPTDRLSLQQVRAHPWMVNGPKHPPPEVFDELEASAELIRR